MKNGTDLRSKLEALAVLTGILALLGVATFLGGCQEPPTTSVVVITGDGSASGDTETTTTTETTGTTEAAP